MKLIGLIGHAGSGKNTFAEEFHFHSYKEFAFAGPLKQACASLFGIPESSFHSTTLKEIPDPYWKVSPREIAQFVGTDLIRIHMGELVDCTNDFWIKRMQYTLYSLESESVAHGEEAKVIITDCRFLNEVQFILSSGGSIIYLTRPSADGIVGISNHASEQFIKEFPEYYPEEGRVHYVTNDGSLDDLRIKAHALAAKL